MSAFKQLSASSFPQAAGQPREPALACSEHQLPSHASQTIPWSAGLCFVNCFQTAQTHEACMERCWCSTDCCHPETQSLRHVVLHAAL